MLIFRCVEDSITGTPPLPDACAGTHAISSSSVFFEPHQGWLPHLAGRPVGPLSGEKSDLPHVWISLKCWIPVCNNTSKLVLPELNTSFPVSKSQSTAFQAGSPYSAFHRRLKTTEMTYNEETGVSRNRASALG